MNKGWFKKGHKTNIGKECKEKTKEKIGIANKKIWASKRVRIYCQYCNNPIDVSKSQLKIQKYCNTRCMYADPEWKNKLSKTVKKLHKKGIYGKEWLKNKKGQIAWNKGKECPKGEQSNNWKGGITSLLQIIFGSLKMKKWRKEVFTRDNYTCQECKKKGIEIEAHHKKAISKIIKQNKIKSLLDAYKCIILWDINNGITLCKDCHRYSRKYHNWNKKHA